VYPAVKASALPTANYLMNKEQIEKQYLLWNRGQRPTSLTTDFLSEAVDPINWIPTARAGAGYLILQCLIFCLYLMVAFLLEMNLLDSHIH
jgi:hypothetical protein